MKREAKYGVEYRSKPDLVLNEIVRQMWQMRRREASSGRLRVNRKSLPPELLILNRFGIGLPYLGVALELSRKFEIPPFEILIQSGIISREIWESAQKMLANERKIVLTGNIERRFLLRNAISGLQSTSPHYSAASTFTAGQVVFGLCLLVFFWLLALVSLSLSLYFLIFVLTLFYLAAILLRGVIISGFADVRGANMQLCPVSDDYLPVYSVFVTLYDEANQIAGLCNALSKLDWPTAKLDIKLICEADDLGTIAAVHDQNLPDHFQLVLVPPAYPRTKPKALNYALPQARGDYLVLYDAEDKPSPGQLREAYINFMTRPQSVACLQAPLEIHNDSENWLCRMFSIEYITLFRGILPVLAKWKAPVPLGGTSNHFKTEILRRVGGWDPFNVTEDADLGIRLHREGYQIGTITLPTFEEAPRFFDGWLKQRTRWIKGWMQTALVHSRDPAQIAREIGILNIATFHLLMTSLVVSALINPFFLLFIYLHFAHFAILVHTPMDAAIIVSCVFNLVGGYTTYGFLAYAVTRARRKSVTYSLSLLTLPVYWLLISFAAWRALFQLFRDPHKWEKTQHGLTSHCFDRKGG